MQLHLGVQLFEPRLLGEVARAHTLVEQPELLAQRRRVLLVPQQPAHLRAQVVYHKLARLRLLPKGCDLAVQLRRVR